MADGVLTIEEILKKATKKAGGPAALCNASGVSRTTLWRLAAGKLKGNARTSTIGKLTAYLLSDD